MLVNAQFPFTFIRVNCKITGCYVLWLNQVTPSISLIQDSRNKNHAHRSSVNGRTFIAEQQ
jgi:hypothetical protein